MCASRIRDRTRETASRAAEIQHLMVVLDATQPDDDRRPEREIVGGVALGFELRRTIPIPDNGRGRVLAPVPIVEPLTSAAPTGRRSVWSRPRSAYTPAAPKARSAPISNSAANHENAVTPA